MDQSGTGNIGTLSNTSWAGAGLGKYGNALSFNGTNSLVNVADSASLHLTTGMTLEAWVKPTALSSWNTVLFKERTGYYADALYANTGSNRPSANAYTTVDNDIRATAQVPLATWTHLAATYDGSVLALYVNGVQAATLIASGSIISSTGALRIGGNTIWGEYFNGLIDEVRIYSRALSATEIQTDMNRAVTNPDSVPPSAPGTLSATGSLSSAQLSWGAATDNVGVARYDVYRSTTSGFTPSTANRIAQPTGTSYTDTVAAGTYYYKVAAEDAAGNVGPSSNEASASVGDSTAPSAPGTLNATGGAGTAALSWGAATDNVGVVRYDVYRSTTSGFTPSTANRIAQPTGTTYTDSVAPGVYFYKVAAEDAAGNIGPASNEASATATGDVTPPTAPSGLAAPVAGSTVNLSWSASTDNVGVAKYDVYRSTTSGFTPSTANRIAQPTGTTYSDTGLAIGTYYYKVAAEDAAGNISPPSNEASAAVADATPPTAPGGLTATGSGSSVSLSWTAATDNVGVVKYDVYRSTVSGFTPSTANRIAQPTGTSYTDTGLGAGTYYYKVAAEDAAGNIGASSNQASATLADTIGPDCTERLGRDRWCRAGASQPGPPRRTTSAWSAMTCTGRRRRVSHRASRTGSRSRPGRVTRIRVSPRARTSTRSAAEDAAGNVGAPSNEANATVTTAAPTGLVAAYGFDEGSGTTTADQSGNANNGTLEQHQLGRGGSRQVRERALLQRHEQPRRTSPTVLRCI